MNEYANMWQCGHCLGFFPDSLGGTDHFAVCVKRAAYHAAKNGQGEVGAKHDAGKPRAGLMLSDFSRALEAVAAVTTYGAAKYSPSSWVSVPDAEPRYRDALMRHLLASITEERDEESGLSHLSHAAWNLLAILQMREGRA